MARKLFISFLGTTFYQECSYYDIKGEYAKTRYIQCATLEQIGAKEWTSKDAVRIFVTDKARTSNWDRNITERNFKEDVLPYSGLEADISAMNLAANIQAVSVCGGKNEKEIWSIFETIYKEINDDDELYIDLTNAFRYLPMLILVLSNYAKFLKHVSIRHLSYGNYEASQNNRAPIVDLMPFTMLQDWTAAASEYLKHGYAKQLTETVTTSLRPLLRDEATRNNAQLVKKFAQLLSDYAAERLTCRGISIEQGKTAKALYDVISRIEDTGIIPLNPVFEKIKGSISASQDSATACIEAARWCYERNLYQQAATLLQEGVISYFCMRHGIETSNKDRRKLITSAIAIKKDNLKREKWLVEETDKTTVDEILSDEFLSLTIAQDLSTLGDLRNDYNHAGFRRNAMGEQKIRANIAKNLETCTNLLVPQTTDKKAKASSSVFLNLSNHPSSQWGEEQKEAALWYGTICDMPFPQIPPTADESDIESMADDILQQIRSNYANARLTVHLMGEMTLTHTLVCRLKAIGIPCVASCTERVVEDLGQGNKISHFRFVRFRAY